MKYLQAGPVLYQRTKPNHSFLPKIQTIFYNSFKIKLTKPQLNELLILITVTMSVIEILTRVDAICKKYDKYDVEKQRDLNISGDDAFARLYATVESDIEAALQVIYV